MKDEELLGVAVVGLGVGARHARTFARHPSCKLRYLLDLDTEKAGALAEELAGCAVAKNYEEILESPDVDIVVIASHDDSHYAYLLDALVSEKHVFVEKPMCLTLNELSSVKRTWLAARKRPILRSNLVLRAAPYYLWLKEAVREGRMGNVYAIDGDYLYGRIGKIVDGWRADVKDYSVMDGGGLHLIDLAIWITGQRPMTVTAAGNGICTKGTRFQYLDYVTAALEFDSGLIARITANFGCVHRHHHVLRLFGTQATAIYDDAGPRIHTSRDPQIPTESLELSALPPDKGALVPSFVQAVLSAEDDSDVTQEFFDGLSVSIAANRAVITGKKERIEYV